LTQGFIVLSFSVLDSPKEVSVDIKKTKYKKVISFLTEMQKQNLLTIKETGKGVHSILEVNSEHDE